MNEYACPLGFADDEDDFALLFTERNQDSELFNLPYFARDSKSISRIIRALRQRMFMLEANWRDTTFIIAGTTQNYVVAYNDNTWTCTCPDFSQRKERCKHIYFVFFRVFRIDIRSWSEFDRRVRDDPYNVYWPRVLEYISSHDLLNESVSYENARKVIGWESVTKKTSIIKRERQPQKVEDDDDCAICQERLNLLVSTSSDDCVVHCCTCGNPLHATCMEVYRTFAQGKCPFCRGMFTVVKVERVTQKRKRAQSENYSAHAEAFLQNEDDGQSDG